MLDKKEKILSFIGGCIMGLVYIYNIISIVMTANLNSINFATVAFVLINGFWLVCVFIKNRKLPFIVASLLMMLYTVVNLISFTWELIINGSANPVSLIFACLICVIPFVTMMVFSFKNIGINRFERYETILAALTTSVVGSVAFISVIGMIAYSFFCNQGIIEESLVNTLFFAIIIALGTSIAELLIVVSFWNPQKDGTEILNKENKRFYISLLPHALLLSFTANIWFLIWVYKTTNFANFAKGEQYRNPLLTLLKCMFVPFYSLYWIYTTTKHIEKILWTKKIFSDSSLMHLIIALFVPAVSCVLMQEKINQYLCTEDVSEDKNEIGLY